MRERRVGHTEYNRSLGASLFQRPQTANVTAWNVLVILIMKRIFRQVNHSERTMLPTDLRRYDLALNSVRGSLHVHMSKFGALSPLACTPYNESYRGAQTDARAHLHR